MSVRCETAGVFAPHLRTACRLIGDNRLALGDGRRVVVDSIDRACPGMERAGRLPVNRADHFAILDALSRPVGVLTRALLAMLGR